MTRLEALQSGRLGDPVPMTSLPFAQTIDLSDAGSDPDEPSPCLPTARSVWYALRPPSAGRLVVDLAGSTPLDPVVRALPIALAPRGEPTFLGWREPVWNAQLASKSRSRRRTSPCPVGTSESREGRLVVASSCAPDAFAQPRRCWPDSRGGPSR
jgi:hypothetical protein